VQVRRPLSRAQSAAGTPKLLQIPGGSNGLYHVEALEAGRPALLVEGELNALTVQQEAGDLITPVGTGTTSWARELRWLMRLGACSLVLQGFDADDDPAKGDKAAGWWLDALGPMALRWRAWGNDANAMLQAGGDVRGWVQAGLEAFQAQRGAA
jgi:hypothetical protein